MAFPQLAERDPPAEVVTLPPKNVAEETSAALQLLMTSLGALSRQTIIGLAKLFTLLTVGSAFWLWCATPNPTPMQLGSLGMYSLFILAVNVIIRRA